MELLLTYLFVALTVSFLCSLLEAALLSVPRSHIAVMVERGTPSGRLLMRMKDDVDRPLAAILTLNTFAHTLGAAGVGAEAAQLWGSRWVGVVGFVVTLLILVFSEIIPKTLGAVHAKGLAPFTAYVSLSMIFLLHPIVLVCDWLSKLLSRKDQRMSAISREEVSSLAHIALEEGTLDKNEARIIRNIIALRDIKAREAMTPRTVVFMLKADQTVREVTEGKPLRFARIPVIGKSFDDVEGLLHRYQLYDALAAGDLDTPLGDLAQPLHAVPESIRLPAVLQDFIDRREHLFLVVDEYGGTAGIITLEDVLETLLGVEIMDETDTVENMQHLARQVLARHWYRHR